MRPPEFAVRIYEEVKGATALAAGGVTLAASVSGLLPSPAAAAPGQPGIGGLPKIINGGGESVPGYGSPLEDVSQLPGFRLHTTKQQSNTLKNATVTVMERTVVDGLPSDWMAICEGTTVSLAGQVPGADVLTSGNDTCVGGGISSNPSLYQGLNVTGGVNPDSSPASGVTEYAVEGALSSSGNSPTLVDGITIDEATGSALLHTTTYGAEVQAAKLAIPVSALAPYRKPVAGEPVVLGSVKAPTGGRFSPLGRLVGTDTISTSDGLGFDGKVDIIGTKALSGKQDVCADTSEGAGVAGPDGKIVGEVAADISGNDALLGEIQQALGVQLIGRYDDLCIVLPAPSRIAAPKSLAIAASLKK
jgi:hypothetical protein